jgi:hypothetical protein
LLQLVPEGALGQAAPRTAIREKQRRKVEEELAMLKAAQLSAYAQLVLWILIWCTS